LGGGKPESLCLIRREWSAAEDSSAGSRLDTVVAFKDGTERAASCSEDAPLLVGNFAVCESEPFVALEGGRIEDPLDCREIADGVAAIVLAAFDEKCVAKGDCTLDDAEAVVGERTFALLVPLYRDPPLLIDRPSDGDPVTVSLATPTEALIRLYKPLRPPWTASDAKLFNSPLLPGRGPAKSSKVVRVSDCEAAPWM
jgi:hypothetical protein